MAYAFNHETLYSKTDNGLEILKLFLSNCKGFDKALQNQKNAFHFRDSDDTASAYLVSPDKKLKSATVDYWRIKDYGDAFYSPISLAMERMGKDYFPCLVDLYKQFGLANGDSFFKAETKFTACEETDKRKVGWFNVTFKDTFFDLNIIGRFVTPAIAKDYHFKSVESYERIFIKKDTGIKTHIKVTATDNYPIFAYSTTKEWCKLYEPLATKDKNGRTSKHGYLGTKPERFIHGFQQILDKVDTDTIDDYNKIIKNSNSENEKKEFIEMRNALMLRSVFICSGGSDGLNVASLGFDAIWFNSESEQITYEEYLKIKPYVQTIYNLPDVDAPGIKYAHEVAEKFFDLKTIYLPNEKLGTKGKDFRDWMKFYTSTDIEGIKRQFYNLTNSALKMRFYEVNQKTKAIKLKPSYLHYFLKVKGFYLYYPEKNFTDKIAEQEYIFIQVVDNIVSQVFPNQIKKFTERYLINKGENIAVLDCIKNSVQFNDKNLLGLDNIVLDFRNYTMNSQLFFFKNLYATVTAEKIDLQPYKNYQNYVWTDAILPKNTMLEKPFFKHTIDENGIGKVEILRSDCEYMNFLINTSRMFWRKELETPFNETQIEEKNAYHDKNRFTLTGDNLTADEHAIQEKHFLNKCFSIGYLLHKQKRQSFAKALYVMDDKAKDSEDDANGRSGKSLFFHGIDQLATNRFYKDGKDKNMTTDKHFLHGLTKENDYLYIEDLDQFINFDFFYNWITGSLTVNPKNTKPYEIKFFDAPKMAFSSNHGLPKCTPSTLGRILFVSFSDYYHIKTDNYLEERKVNADFNGQDLFSTTWTELQWNKFYNFLLQCVQLYLQNFDHEINAPQNNININNAMASMGEVFMEWCDSYFIETQTAEIDGNQEVITGTLNEYVSRAEMQKSYNDRAGKFAKTSNNFKKSLLQYCKMKNYTLNPKNLCGSDNTIKKPIVDDKGKRQIVEYFFIQTPLSETEITTIEPSDDLPF